MARKLLLEGITGSDLRENNLLSQIAEYIGARKESILDSSKDRTTVENNHKLIPIVARLERKSPEGTNIISIEWKIKCVAFYETDGVSDILKGHNNVFKVNYLALALRQDLFFMCLSFL